MEKQKILNLEQQIPFKYGKNLRTDEVSLIKDMYAENGDIIQEINTIEGLNAEETYKAEKQLKEEEIFGAFQFDIPTPTIDAYARRNGLDAK